MVRQFLIQLRQSTLQHPRITKHFLLQLFPVQKFPRSVHKFSHLRYIGPILDYLRFLIFHVPTTKFQQQLSQYVKYNMRLSSRTPSTAMMNSNMIQSQSDNSTGYTNILSSLPIASRKSRQHLHKQKHKAISQYGSLLQEKTLLPFHQALTQQQCEIIHKELKEGNRKQGHWMWYAFPVDIYDVLKGTAYTPSKTSIQYSIKPSGVKAFLKDPFLKKYYKKTLAILVKRLDEENKTFDLKKFFGDIDYNKFKFHINLFYCICQEMNCEEIGNLTRIYNHIHRTSTTKSIKRLTPCQIRST